MEVKGPFLHWDGRIKDLALELDAEAGHTYYMRLNIFDEPSFSDDLGIFVVCRNDNYLLNGPYPSLYLNGVEEEVLYNGFYRVYRLPPGPYSWEVKGSFVFTPEKFDAEANKNYYVWFSVGKETEKTEKTMPLKLGTLWWVAPELALKELKSLRLSE